MSMEPQTIVFSSNHLDKQNQATASADLRQANLRTGALLFLSVTMAVFAVMTTAHIPTLLADAAVGKLLVVVGFNLFAGYMLFDALSELRQLCCLHWRCQTVEAELVQIEGEAFKQAAVFAGASKGLLPLEIGYRFVCPKTGVSVTNSRKVMWQFRPKSPHPKVGDNILLHYVDADLHVVL